MNEVLQRADGNCSGTDVEHDYTYLPTFDLINFGLDRTSGGFPQ